MRRVFLAALSKVSTVIYFLCGCKSLEPFGQQVKKEKIPADWKLSERGWASYYGSEFVGRRTASGDPYIESEMTAAHPTLPFGTIVLVRRSATGRYAFVRVTDRGPFIQGRIIDLSRAAAAKIDLLAAGVGRVELFVIPPHHELIGHL